jgi:hypothetical protein
MDKSLNELYKRKKNKYKLKYKLLKQQIMSGGQIDSSLEYFWGAIYYLFNDYKSKAGEPEISHFISSQREPMTIFKFVNEFKTQNIEKTLYFTCNFIYTIQCNKYFGLKKEKCEKNRTIIIELKKDLDKIKLSYWTRNKKEHVIIIRPDNNINGFIESLKKENKEDDIPDFDVESLIIKEVIPVYK